MRIKAKIEISNRSLAVHNMSGRKGKDAQALLAIGKKPKGLTQSTLKESNKVRFSKFNLSFFQNKPPNYIPSEGMLVPKQIYINYF